MSNFNDFIDNLDESRKITLKRRYTENHPAVEVGKVARVRNKMLEAIADGKITQEEFNAILKEYSADAGKWMRRNAKYFSVSEEGISLSVFGKRALSSITVNESETLFEATVEMDAMDPDNKDFLKFLAKNKVNIISKEMSGPNAKTPVITMQGKRKDLEAVLADEEFGWADPDLAEYIEESLVTENYEVIYSDGVSAMKKFRSEAQALDFMKKTIASNKKLRDIAVYKPGMYSTTQTELVVKFWGDGSYLDNVSKKDPELAAKKLEESVDADHVEEGRAFVAAARKAKDEGKEEFEYDGKTYPVTIKEETETEDIKMKNKRMFESFTNFVNNLSVNEDVFGDLEMAISDMDFDAYQNLAFEFGIDTEDPNMMMDFIYNELDKKGAKLLIKNINKGVYESVVNESEAENILQDLLDERGGDMGELHGMSMEDALDTVETYGHKGSKAKKIAKELFSMCNESVVNESEAENILQDLLDERGGDMGELHGMSMEDALDTVETYGHKGSKAKKIAKELFSMCNESVVNEAFSSMKLQSILTKAGSMPKDFAKTFYQMAKIQLDKIQDVDIIEMDPEQARKEKRNRAVYLYFTTNEKPNPYAGRNSWGVTTIPGNTLLGVTDGSNEWLAAEYSRGWGADKRTKSLAKTKRNDGAGFGKSAANDTWGSGISSLSKVAELADRAYVLDLDILRARYSSTAQRDKRTAAKKGATAFQSDKDFKKQNLDRYHTILADRAASMPVDKEVLKAIDVVTSQIKDGLATGEKGKYGDVIIGKDPKGREVKLRDASNAMQNLLDDFNRYVDYTNQAKREEEAGYGSDYYSREVKNYAKSIKDRISKIEKMDYVW